MARTPSLSPSSSPRRQLRASCGATQLWIVFLVVSTASVLLSVSLVYRAHHSNHNDDYEGTKGLASLLLRTKQEFQRIGKRGPERIERVRAAASKKNATSGNAPDQAPSPDKKPKASEPDDHNSKAEPIITMNKNNGYTFHIVVSSGCNALQDWQSYMYFHQILASGFDGHATRVASCETDEQAAALRRVHEEQIEGPMSSKFHLHTTPDYTRVAGEPKYNFFNKPLGLRHWIQHGLGFPQNLAQHEKTIFVILDPDQFYVRPFVQDMTHEEELWMDDAGYRQVKVGQPMAAQYGFGTGFVHTLDAQKLANLPNLTIPLPPNQTSGLLSWNDKIAHKHYSIGPPYVSVAADFFKIVTTWAEMVVPVHQQTNGAFLAEMYAYSAAAAHLNLPHQSSRSFQVSDPTSTHPEAWKEWMDAPNASTHVCATTMQPIPHVLHYCQRYYLGHYFFSKYQVPKGKDADDGVFLSCEHPLYEEPSSNVADIFQAATTLDGNLHKLNRSQRLRMAFMLCQLLPRINAAAAFYKQHHCNSDNNNVAGSAANFSKVFVHETHQAKKQRLKKERKARQEQERKKR